MKKTRASTFLLVTMFILPLAVSAISLEHNGQPTPQDTHDVWVDQLSSYAYYTYCEDGDTLYGEFEVVYGSDIDFFICTEDNYDAWIDGDDATAIFSRSNVGSQEWSISISNDDRYYIVYYNDNWLYRKHIEGSITRYSPPSSSTSSSAALGFLLVGGGALFLVLVCICNNSKKQQVKHPPPYGSPPLLPITDHRFQQRPVTGRSYCPYCGSSGIPLRAKYCPSCGAGIGDPPNIT